MSFSKNCDYVIIYSKAEELTQFKSGWWATLWATTKSIVGTRGHTSPQLLYMALCPRHLLPGLQWTTVTAGPTAGCGQWGRLIPEPCPAHHWIFMAPGVKQSLFHNNLWNWDPLGVSGKILHILAGCVWSHDRAGLLKGRKHRHGGLCRVCLCWQSVLDQ